MEVNDSYVWLNNKVRCCRSCSLKLYGVKNIVLMKCERKDKVIVDDDDEQYLRDLL